MVVYDKQNARSKTSKATPQNAVVKEQWCLMRREGEGVRMLDSGNRYLNSTSSSILIQSSSATQGIVEYGILRAIIFAASCELNLIGTRAANVDSCCDLQLHRYDLSLQLCIH